MKGTEVSGVWKAVEVSNARQLRRLSVGGVVQFGGWFGGVAVSLSVSQAFSSILKEASSSDVPLGVAWSGLVSSLDRLAFRCRSGAADATAGFARARGGSPGGSLKGR